MLSKKLWTYLKHVPKIVEIKRVTLFVHLESDGVLVVRISILEFFHVDSRDTCSDQKGLMKGSVRENIQCKLKCWFFRFECGAQFVIAASNLETLFPWNKSIVKCLLLFFCDTHDSAKKESIQFSSLKLRIRALNDVANSNGKAHCEFVSLSVLQIRSLLHIANSCPKGCLRIRTLYQIANSNTEGSLPIRIQKTYCKFVPYCILRIRVLKVVCEFGPSIKLLIRILKVAANSDPMSNCKFEY
ncbi:hypothetical protein Tco_1308185 [Tanacetum coccineum]